MGLLGPKLTPGQTDTLNALKTAIADFDERARKYARENHSQFRRTEGRFSDPEKYGESEVEDERVRLRAYKESGTPIKGEVSSALLLSIFNPSSPLHDGAAILQNTLMEAAGCILPLTESDMVNPDMGTRHRAALGLTEESDAIVIVVSEERGAIAAAENGRFVNLDMDEMSLRRYLNERLFISSGD